MKNTDFKFLVINTKARWAEGDKKNLEVSDAGITLKKEPSYILEREIGKSEGWANATDIAVDTCDVLYILDASRHCILTYDTANKRTERLKCIGGDGELPEFTDAKGIALSPDTLYVADTGNNRIQAFARINLQIRWIHEVAEPSDISIDDEGNLHVIAQENCILKFNKGGKFLRKFGEQKLEKPVNIAIDKTGFLYVLDYDKREVLKFEREGNKVEAVFNLNEVPEIYPSWVAVDLEGNVYVGDRREIEREGEERFIHKFEPSGKYAGPLRGYRGLCYGMVMDKLSNFYVTTGEKGVIAFLKYIKERYFIEEPGTFISKVLDSNELDCRWHKIVLDAEIPDKTQIDVHYYTSDKKRAEMEILELNDSEWTKPTTFYASTLKLRDALIQSPSGGRYLWLKLRLISSDEYKTPKIKSIKAYFPRISYLRYLPAVYQENAASRDFLERFLSLFETFLWNKEEEITQIARYFDVKATPGDFISWLATWVAAIFDESWSEEKRQIFLQRAVELYKKRGTREGLEELIEIYTGNKPMIVENFLLYKKDAVGNSKLGYEENEEMKKTLEKLFGELTPYNFCVLLKPGQEGIESQLKTIKRLIEFEKPAHTNAGVVVLQPWIYLDMHTYLEINTYLSKPVMRLGIMSVIGRDTVLTCTEGAGQIEKRSRTGMDTELT